MPDPHLPSAASGDPSTERAPSLAAGGADDTFAAKARTLMALLGPDRLEDLAQSALPTALARRLLAAAIPPGTESGVDMADDTHVPDLLRRLAPRRRGPRDLKALAERIALAARPGDLPNEHPAVIAILLRAQDPRTQAQTLRRLPGATARAVLRHMSLVAGDSASRRRP